MANLKLGDKFMAIDAYLQIDVTIIFMSKSERV